MKTPNTVHRRMIDQELESESGVECKFLGYGNHGMTVRVILPILPRQSSANGTKNRMLSAASMPPSRSRTVTTQCRRDREDETKPTIVDFSTDSPEAFHKIDVAFRKELERRDVDFSRTIEAQDQYFRAAFRKELEQRDADFLRKIEAQDQDFRGTFQH